MKRKHLSILFIALVLALIGIMVFLWFKPYTLSQVIGSRTDTQYELFSISSHEALLDPAEQRWEQDTRDVDINAVPAETKQAIVDILFAATYSKRIEPETWTGKHFYLYLQDTDLALHAFIYRIDDRGIASISLLSKGTYSTLSIDAASFGKLMALLETLP